MSSHESLLLVRMMRYQGILADRELEKVISMAEGCSDHRELLRNLEALGIVTSDWARSIDDYVVTRSRSRSGEPEELFRLDRSFGQLALGKQWICLADLEDALLEQERLRRRNLYFRVGEILVRLGSLSVAQVREILAEQGCAILRCDTCRRIIAVDGRKPKVCECSGELSAPVFLELVKADS